MHCPIGNDYEGAGEDAETDNVLPQSQVVKAKRTENGSTWYFYVKTIFVID